MKKVYIAGPITGDPNYKVKFKGLEDKLRKLGLDPVNPADAPEGLTYREYIDRGLKLLMDCDIICCMTTSPGNPDKRRWPPESKGEHLEWQYACTVGVPIMQACLVRSFNGNGEYQKAEWNIEIPKCWPGMFGGGEG